MNISANISSMYAHQTMMNNSANNVANINSGGFKPTDTKMMQNSESSISANSRKADDTGSKMSQTNLSKEIVDQGISKDATALNATAIKTQDQMLGSLLDLKA